MSDSQIVITAAVGLFASIVTAVVTHLLTRAQDRRKYEREVTAKLAALNSTMRSNTMVMAVQYGHSCFIVEGPTPEQRDRVFLPIGSRITLGSAAENHIVIVDEHVSVMHATFRADGDVAWAESLGAANGIAVNGTVTHKPRKLAVGDVVTIPGAPHRITFVPLVR